jgi:hypothetical protein
MKIYELFGGSLKSEGWRSKDFGEEYSDNGHTHERKILIRYFDKDCVVCYSKEKLGMIFIIRGKAKYFAFVSLKYKLDMHGYNYKLSRITPKQALRLMDGDYTVVDKDRMGELNKLMILEGLENKNDSY